MGTQNAVFPTVGEPEGMRLGRIAGWLGSRRASTLLALLAILTMGPLILLSTLSLNSTYAALAAASNHRLTDASALAAAYVNTEMTSLAAVDDSFATRPSLIAALGDGNHLNYDKPVILADLNTIRAIQSNTRFAGIVDATGSYWGDQNPVGPASALGQNFSARDWYQGTIRTGKAYVSSAYVSSDITAPLVVAIADPVRADGHSAPKGTVLGILVVGYELSATQRLFSDFAHNQGVAIEVTDQRGVVVAKSGAVPKKLVQDNSAGVTAALRGTSSLAQVNVGGEDDLAAYAPVADIGWTSVTTVPASVALADANRLRAYVVAITIVLLALLAGTMVILYLAFREERARNLVLAGANRNLEQRVAARTLEVEASNIKLEAANRHKTTFLANMSHELRTPLNAILGFSELLRDDKTGRFDTSTQHRFLDQIHTSGQHLLGLINDILDLSKVEAGQMDLHLEQVELAESIQNVLSTVEPLARTKKIVLEADSVPGLHLVADPTKLKQMLLNLVSNAIKFTPKGGRVVIRDREVDSWIEIAVTDTGIGIEAADLDRLFTEFYQLDAGHGRQQEGTGLGLALTKRYAELHGGEVNVESKPGQGSTFILRLPVDGKKPIEVPVQEAPRIGPSDGDRPLVLVVEDNTDAAEILARHLEAGGFRMSIARTGIAALAMARELKPVAITLDILLPGIDGWEVLTRLKADEQTRDIPVVVISVTDNPGLGRALGALDYFVKPVDRGALLSRLGQYTFTTKVQHGEVRILLVDDEPANLDLLQALLEPEGFKVLKASGGQEGIDVARAQRPQLILLDLLMPDVNGFDVVETLRADDVTRSIPIMVLTAKKLTKGDKAALNGGVAAIFQRNSVGGAELVDWLRRFVAKGRAA
jgi:signal transduction histidine kinase/DNA-binding response OmpR family regulator